MHNLWFVTSMMHASFLQHFTKSSNFALCWVQKFRQCTVINLLQKSVFCFLSLLLEWTGVIAKKLINDEFYGNIEATD